MQVPWPVCSTSWYWYHPFGYVQTDIVMMSLVCVIFTVPVYYWCVFFCREYSKRLDIWYSVTKVWVCTCHSCSISCCLKIFIPHHTIVAGYYGFTLDVRVSVRPSAVRPSIRFSFQDDNLSKCQWIFTKLCMCIDIVDIWFGIANGQISSNFYGVTPIFLFWDNNLSK